MEEDNKNNTGNSNSGDWNSGDRNSGDSNSGYSNSGYRNSGDRNSGNWNSGNWNSGDSNSGDSNTGNSNSGNWNSGNRNSGYFNIDEPKVRIFGKETEIKREDINFPSWIFFDLTEWVSFQDMTDKEKENNTFAEFTQGYLKTYEYKEAFKNNFDKAGIDDIKLTLELPNFDYDIFEEISGISKSDFDDKINLDLNIKIIDGKRYKLIE